MKIHKTHMGIRMVRDIMLRNWLPLVMVGFVLPAAGGCAGHKNGTTTTPEVRQEVQLSFSGDSAMQSVNQQVAYGPRVPGTKAHYTVAEVLKQQMRDFGLRVVPQTTTLKTFDNQTIPVYNILGSINPDAEKRLMIVAHWDTRPWADQDKDPKKRHLPVPGANDGASGTALCLELARVLAPRTDLNIGVDFLLVDAEDWGTDGDEDSWAMGTRYFVENPPAEWQIPEGVIVVDMVGDAEATFRPEYFSEQSAPGLNRRIWAIANDLGYGKYFLNSAGGAITDDHVPFIEGGIPAVDIVDYRVSPQGFVPQWHTTEDLPKYMSPQTLEAVGRTLESLIIDY